MARARQLCRKPMASGLWRFDEVIAHWDRLVLRAYALEGGERNAGHGERARRRPATQDLLSACAAERARPATRFPVGTIMFCV